MRYVWDSRLGLAAQALAIFVCLDVGCRWFGFPSVYRLVRSRSRGFGAALSAPAPDVVDRTLDAVRTATRYYWRRRLDCLPRAMTVYLLLKRRGIAATLHIGVKRYPFAAHAWVVHDGHVLGHPANSWRHEPYVPIISM